MNYQYQYSTILYATAERAIAAAIEDYITAGDNNSAADVAEIVSMHPADLLSDMHGWLAEYRHEITTDDLLDIVREVCDGLRREAVERVLEEWVFDANELAQDDGSYLVAWETEYDEFGELTEDPVEEMRHKLPPGWTISWTGDANGDDEYFRLGEDQT